jgi:hypothetical protein
LENTVLVTRGGAAQAEWVPSSGDTDTVSRLLEQLELMKKYAERKLGRRDRSLHEVYRGSRKNVWAEMSGYENNGFS